MRPVGPLWARSGQKQAAGFRAAWTGLRTFVEIGPPDCESERVAAAGVLDVCPSALRRAEQPCRDAGRTLRDALKRNCCNDRGGRPQGGTDAEEKWLWQKAGIASAVARYRDIGCGRAALNAASAMAAYMLSDRGTWLSYGHKEGMKIVLEGDRRPQPLRCHPAGAADAFSGEARRPMRSPTGSPQEGLGGDRLLHFHPEADPG
jgi:hypothetical protein